MFVIVRARIDAAGRAQTDPAVTKVRVRRAVLGYLRWTPRTSGGAA